MGSAVVEPDRRAELAASVATVEARIDAACRAAGRNRNEVTIIGVTKFFPAADAAALADLGLVNLGESRDQEAAAKVVEVAGLSTAAVRWHFVGRLQSNKAAHVAEYVDVVHSMDRLSLVEPLSRGVRSVDRAALDVLIQVSLDDDPARGGAPSDHVRQLAADLSGYPSLRLAGVMAVAPMGADPDVAFARLEQISHELRSDHPGATVVSAGMSGDLEAAVRHGATHLRIGTALLGRRSTTFR